MKRIFPILLAFGLLTSCSQNRPVKSYETFPEMEDPAVDTLSDWSKVDSLTLMTSYVSIDNKYPKSVLPEINEISTEQKVVAWKGEKVSAQILLWLQVILRKRSLNLAISSRMEIHCQLMLLKLDLFDM